VFVSSDPTVPYEAAYSLLLGYWLGDGHSARMARTVSLRITLDARYPGIVEECAEAMRRTVRRDTVRCRRHRVHRCIIVGCYWHEWPGLIPQIGPGRKHERAITLEPWQRAILDRQPRAFLRGLLMSDGCRCINRFKVALPSGRLAEYAYPRYFFSNLSEDIRGLFCEYCDRLGIRWTQSNPRNISVAHRRSVALLDEFVGPKR
jgi:hypothetical protein